MGTENLTGKAVKEATKPIKSFASFGSTVGIGYAVEKLGGQKVVVGTWKERLIKNIVSILQQKIQ